MRKLRSRGAGLRDSADDLQVAGLQAGWRGDVEEKLKLHEEAYWAAVAANDGLAAGVALRDGAIAHLGLGQYCDALEAGRHSTNTLHKAGASTRHLLATRAVIARTATCALAARGLGSPESEPEAFKATGLLAAGFPDTSPYSLTSEVNEVRAGLRGLRTESGRPDQFEVIFAARLVAAMLMHNSSRRSAISAAVEATRLGFISENARYVNETTPQRDMNTAIRLKNRFMHVGAGLTALAASVAPHNTRLRLIKRICS